jgi:ketosteroid isomerase-like protein
MTSEGQEFAQRFIAAMNAHDVAAVAACYGPGAVIRYPGRPAQSVEEYTKGEKEMLAAVPDYRIEATSVLESNDGSVVVELEMQGTQREDLGGRAFKVTGAYIFRLAEGKAVEERAYPDIAGLRRQLSGK